MSDDIERDQVARGAQASAPVDDALAALDRSIHELRARIESLRAEEGDEPVAGARIEPERRGGGASARVGPHGGRPYEPVPAAAPESSPSARAVAEPAAPAGGPLAAVRAPVGGAGPAPAAAPGAEAGGPVARAVAPEPARRAERSPPATLARARALAQELVETLDRLLEAEAASAHGGLPEPAWERRSATATSRQAPVEIDAGPFATLAQIHGFEAALARLPYAEEVHVRGFREGRAAIEVRFGAPVAIEDELPHVLAEDFRATRSPDGRLAVELVRGAAGGRSA